LDAIDLDVLIVGAGLSGVSAAWHLKQRCPDRQVAIIEARDAMGGTWDLFRYPGVRSDSDMFTLGYRFRPWREAKAIADGPSILRYVRETARENGIDRLIRYNQKLTAAHWDSKTACWHVTVNGGTAQVQQYRTAFLWLCAGYYSYDKPIDPPFEGRADFAGQIIHPQFWPEALDYGGKQVVVIGSGATAVTLVPAIAAKAAHVTMLQRSPTFYALQPSEDRLANGLRALLPEKLAYFLNRWRKILIGQFFYKLTRRYPHALKKLLIKGATNALNDKTQVARNFTPRYFPWDQRLCLVPDNDLFEAINSGKASVVTDQIARFTPSGISLASGRELPADIIVTATGLSVAIGDGMDLRVDGTPVNWSEKIGYKGLMFSDVPNLFSTFGYTNASWTLKADLTADYVCRLLNHMARHGQHAAMPHNDDAALESIAWVDFSSTYLTRVADRLPKQGSRKPWRLDQDYLKDLFILRYSRIDDGVLKLSSLQAAK
jgi:monooxygenase